MTPPIQLERIDPLPAELPAALRPWATQAVTRWRPAWEQACEAARAELGEAPVDAALAALRAWLPRLADEPAPTLEAGDAVGLRWAGAGCWRCPAGWVPRRPRAQLGAALRDWVRGELLDGLPRDSGMGPTLEAAQRLGRLAVEPWLELCELRRQLWLLPTPLSASYRVHRDVLPAGWDGADAVVDSATLTPAQQEQLWAGCADRDAALRGVLFLGDNLRALGLLQRRFRGRVQCAYLDPPFNTGSSAFAYDDRRGRAAWLGFIDDRLERLTPLLTGDGTLYAHIDYAEKERLRLLLDRRLHYVTEVIWRIGWLSGFKTRARKFIRNHDTIYQFGACPKPLFRKRYLPYPDGYVRRDGKPPTGKGYPLEDTWNCSPLDRLDSILIKSFSREKVGGGNLTQKNEALLERLWDASSAPGDWVLDPFCGSGTGPAVAHKTGRRWLAVEAGDEPGRVALERLTGVLAGDRYGISAQTGWEGGGAFAVLELASHDDLCQALGAPDDDPDALRLTWDGQRLRWSPTEAPDPFACRLAGSGRPVDLPEWCAWLLGLHVKRVERVGEAWVVAGRDPEGARVLLVWRRLAEATADGLSAVLGHYLRGIEAEGGRIYVHGEPGRADAARRWPAWRVQSTATVLGAEGLTEPAAGV